MPGMDRTGPFVTGPRGWGRGPCGGGQGGPGRGRGFGRGRWGGPGPVWTPEEEKSALEEQKSWLKAQLEAIEKRLGGGTTNSDPI